LALNCQEATVFADRDKIGQVMTNLINNAIKYSTDDETILIQSEYEQQKVRVSITDHGIGINALDQERLFERFYRVNNDKSSKVEGFGIGLYLVSEILRYHHSTIKVISEQGKGSTFYFDLDLSPIN
jgi:two-component system sensor histidine kinase VicK